MTRFIHAKSARTYLNTLIKQTTEEESKGVAQIGRLFGFGINNKRFLSAPNTYRDKEELKEMASALIEASNNEEEKRGLRLAAKGLSIYE